VLAESVSQSVLMICVCVDADYLSVAVRQLNHQVPGLCEVNHVQKAAVRHAVVQSFSLIQGPPGTGKTLTAVHLAALFVRINRNLSANYDRAGTRPQLLICGPSDKSVDIIASEYFDDTDKVKVKVKAG